MKDLGAIRVFLVLSLSLGAACAASRRAPDPGAAGISASAGGADESEFDEFEEFGGEEEAGRVSDPLGGYNRFMFNVNDKFYYWVAKPLTRGYGYVVPEPARVSIGKAFNNLYSPLRFVNCALQLKFKKAGTELGRFVVNSTVGLGGLFDPAGRYLKWHDNDEDFGQTLGHYGVGDGFPLVLPLLGQSNLRDGLSIIPGIIVHPVTYAAATETSVAVKTGEQFNWISLHIGEYESVKKDALDPYTFIRDAYKQKRDKEIRE